MGEYKPLGSEKLSQDEKLKRILELTYYDRDNKKNTANQNIVKESSNGGVYGIVKEKDGYYVKRGLTESTLDYIGGMFMKNKNRFSSYSEAFKRLEFLRGQENLQEATKYILKKDKPQQEAPMPQPSMDMPPPPSSPEGDAMPPAPSGDMPPSSETGAIPPPEDDMSMPPAPEGKDSTEPKDAETGMETGPSKKSDYMAEIQKYSGKLGQELRDQAEKMESDDIKYVLNMIISAVDLDKLELEDLEDIGKKFERDEEESSDTEPMPEPSDDTTPEPPQEEPEGDLDEDMDPMDKLEAFVKDNTYDVHEDDFESYAIKETDEVDSDEIVELDMNEINSEIAKSVRETLSKYFNK